MIYANISYIPVPMQAAIWMRDSCVGARSPTVAATPDDTPIIPRALPAKIKLTVYYMFAK